MLEEVGDLVDQDRRHLTIAGDIGVEGVQLVDRHRQDLFVAASLVFHHQSADRARANDHARIDGGRTDDQDVARIAVIGQGVGDEAVIAGIVHRRIEEAVDEQRARILVHLVLHRHTALRNLDDGVNVPRCVRADGDFVDIHWIQ